MKKPKKVNPVVSPMDNSFRRRLGRIEHDLALYTLVSNLGSVNKSPNEYWKGGWESGAKQTIRNLMRSLFDSDATGNVVDVGNNQFVLWFNGYKYSFPGGIVSRLYMGCFPHAVTIDVIVDPINPMSWQIYQMVGKPGTYFENR